MITANADITWALIHSVAPINPIFCNYLVQCFNIKWVSSNYEHSSHRNLLYGINSKSMKYGSITSTNKRSAENICEQSGLDQLMCLIIGKSVQLTPYTPSFCKKCKLLLSSTFLKQYFLSHWTWWTIYKCPPTGSNLIQMIWKSIK